jgi:hypothetical protein
MRVRRGTRLPKRLVEATLGAVVAQTLPGAVIWASTYRPEDGVGVSPSADRLLFQCSPADERLHGLSTRVNRKMLARFAADPPLEAWRGHAQFILVAARDDWKDLGERRDLGLWAISAACLGVFTDERMRGTVDSQDLKQLAAEGHARRLEELLGLFSQGKAELQPPIPEVASTSLRYQQQWGWGFGLNAPTPVGIALDPLDRT